jgi:signal recognition particle subunit SRP54
MVLAELGSKITAALRNMRDSTLIDEEVVNRLVKELALALLQSDVDVHLVKQMQENIRRKSNAEDMPPGANRRKMIQSIVIREIMNLLDPGREPYVPKKGRCNVIMFVGLQGSGKTTSCTKLAYYYKRKGWKTCLVCADTFRAGAFDQLKQNATKAKIPFYGDYTEPDPAVVAENGVKQFRKEKFEIIIVDTSGRHKQESALFEEMKQVARVTEPDDIIFVMDSSIGQAARDQAKAFRDAVSVGSIILTKLDGHAKGGGALSAVAATKSPVVFVGTGEHIDNFEPFNAKSFVSKLLGLGDPEELLRLFGENKAFDAEKQQELYKRITEEGQFTFRDMYDQFQGLLKMGPLGQIMQMIPGLGQLMAGQGREEESVKRIKRFLCIMDSMTPQEMDSDVKIFNSQPSRIARIAKGSGRSVREVQELIETFKPFQKFAARMRGKTNMMDPKKMMGPQGMRNIAQMFDPRMLQQLGGPQNLQKMLKEFGGKLPGM